MIDLPRVLIREGTQYVCDLYPGDEWREFGNRILIANPDRPPRVVTFVDGEPVVTVLSYSLPAA